MSGKRHLPAIYEKMFSHYGPRHWWPGETPFEVMVGAILTQNAAWTNVEKAIANLRSASCLTPQKIFALSPTELARLIQPAGFFRVKTKRLRNFLQFFLETYDGDADRMKQEPMEKLRSELLSVSGIGPETADSILLYALEKPTFVIDAYTHRILNRHHLCTEEEGYEELQQYFMDSLEPKVSHFNEFHALLVNIGKDFCKPKPRCEKCPLNGYNW